MNAAIGMGPVTWRFTGDVSRRLGKLLVELLRTFIALAKVRASGVDHFLSSNVEVEFHRLEHVQNIELRDLRRVCDAARRAAVFIFARVGWERQDLSEAVARGSNWQDARLVKSEIAIGLQVIKWPGTVSLHVYRSPQKLRYT